MADIDQEPTTCVVCSEGIASTLVIPCGHVVVCDKCSDKLKTDALNSHKCVICRREIECVLKDEIKYPEKKPDKVDEKDTIKKKSNTDYNLCIRCCSDVANTMVLPCGDIVACLKCSDELKSDPDYAYRCIACNKGITEVLVDRS